MKLEIIKMGINGEGIGYDHKTPVFVPKAYPTEIVDVNIIEDKGKYKRAELVKILKEAEFRVEPKCDHQDKCGGCALMNMRYIRQLQYKKENLQQTLLKYAGIPFRMVDQVIANEDHLYYRNSFKLPVKYVNGALTTCMYEEGTNHVMPIRKCMVHEKGLEAMRKQILEVLNKHGVHAYNEKLQKGLRYLVVRTFDGKYQCTLVSGKDRYHDSLINDLMAIPDLKSLVQNVNTNTKSNEIFSSEFHYLGGTRKLPLKLGDLKMEVSPASFFQMNTKQAYRMYQYAADLIDDAHVLVEAYCGIGTISLMCKDKAEKIIGIELNKDAVKNANENAYLNHVDDKVKFLVGDAGKVMERVFREQHVDALIVDPPRTGLDDKMISLLLDNPVRQLVYISCNAATLAKNLKQLGEVYEVKSIQPFDMFSQTPLVETVVLLTAKADF
ncbi:MAG: 23S rRNA (uracil(1939)-C(5))-methyltransferase RlmD [Erysipelotrichaceae bacterium]|nr:23S rRNA (uracil(1939)-C(5))-methyltransferase RlmD [Erysipelotrichaceae bacterium]